VVAKGKYADEVSVTQCMSKNPITCHPENDLQKAEQLMKAHQIRRIPVVDEQDHLVGIIAQADIALKTKEPQEVGSIVQEVSKPERARPAKAA
jgi:CBS-domain-containing membrane protein